MWLEWHDKGENEMLRINNSKSVLIFPKQTNFRSRFSQIEEKLSRTFLPGQLLPIPDDAPAEIPRMIFNSMGGHSTLTITCATSQIETRYDNNYCENIEKCFEYMSMKFANMYDVVSDTIRDSILYVGTSVNCSYFGVDTMEFMNSRFVNIAYEKTPTEVMARLVYEFENKYYVNLQFNNAKQYQIETMNVFSSLYGVKNAEPSITIDVDVNDRLAFNFVKSYRSSRKEPDEVLKLARSFIDKDLKSFI